MCGIVGICAVGEPIAIDEDLLARMAACLEHRGPDGGGQHCEPGRVGIAMRRLAVIDVAGGEQPLASEDGSVWTVFNGEIYNFRELRARLESHGHRFATRSDTEVLVHGYEQWGEDVVGELRGMFAFAIWDARRGRLLLARDRLGIKPLFLARIPGGLLFASEIKSLLLHPEVDRELSLSGLNHLFTFSYAPPPLTLYRGIEELEPGHRLRVAEGRIHRERYWSLRPTLARGRRAEELAEELRARLAESVRLHRVADVPLGAFLSGGIDSSTVVALLARESGEPVRTFSIGYEQGQAWYDERPYARRIAELCSTRHTEFVVRPDLSEVIPEVVRGFDQPFGDSSAIPNWYLSRLTRRHVTVALSGLGGDELFAGYERHRGVVAAERLRARGWRLPLRLAAKATRWLPETANGNPWVERGKRFFAAAGLEPDARYLAYLSPFGTDLRSRVLSRDVLAQLDPSEPLALLRERVERAEREHPLERALLADLLIYLPGDLLPLSDRMSMAHGLELRVPFLDHPLVEFAATIPPELKLRGGELKFLLKRAIADLVPRELRERPKRGFSVPLGLWFRDSLRPYLEEALAPRVLRETGVLDPEGVHRLLEEHFTRRRNHDTALWTLLTFVVWWREYMAGATRLERSTRVFGAPCGF